MKTIPELPSLPSDVTAHSLETIQPIYVDVMLTKPEWYLKNRLSAHYCAYQERPFTRGQLSLIICILGVLLGIGSIIESYTNDMFFAVFMIFCLGICSIFLYKKIYIPKITNTLKEYNKPQWFAGYTGLSRYRISLTTAGIIYGAGRLGGSFLLPWHQVVYFEKSSKELCIYGGNQLIYIPIRCFNDKQQAAHFISQIEQCSTCPCQDKVNLLSNTQPAEQSVFKTATADSVQNIRAGILFFMWQRRGIRGLNVSPFQFIILAALYMLVRILNDLITAGWNSEFNTLAIGLYGGELLWILFIAWLISIWVRQTVSLLDAAMIILVIAIPVFCIQILLSLLMQYTTTGIVTIFMLLSSMLLLNFILTTGYGVAWRYGISKHGQILVMMLMVLTMLPSVVIEDYYSGFWHKNYDEEEDKVYFERLNKTSMESVLYQQSELLTAAMANVAQGEMGIPELYFVGFAGDGSQDVFKREIQSVEDLFIKRFNTQQRSVALINNPYTANTHAFATLTALERVLSVVGERMNTEEDILFLFMTSHGSQNPPSFYVNLWPFTLTQITPDNLQSALEKSGIKNRVIVISACYSGGFIQPLADENTLIISASLPDRSSYGCSHENDWTFFGQAYFHEALRQTFSFEEAFKMAEKNIAEREKAEGYTPSEPQIYVGKNIIERLKVIENHLKTQQRSIEK